MTDVALAAETNMHLAAKLKSEPPYRTPSRTKASAVMGCVSTTKGRRKSMPDRTLWSSLNRPGRIPLEA